MFHVGTLHQTSKVKASSGRGGQVGGGLGGEVGVNERGEIGLVNEKSRAAGCGAAPYWVELIVRQAVTTKGSVSFGTQTLRFRSAAHAVPAIPLVPAATAAAAPQPGETKTSVSITERNVSASADLNVE